MGLMAGIRFPAVENNSSVLPIVQTGSGARTSSSARDIGDAIPGEKRPASEADHEPLSSVEVKNDGAIFRLPLHTLPSRLGD